MEKTASFLRLRQLRRVHQARRRRLERHALQRALINLLSHGDYSLYEPREMLEENKRALPQDAAASSSTASPVQPGTVPERSRSDAMRDTMTEHDQKQLGKTLWNIADQLRGAMNADDFRDYMLVVPVPALPLGQLRGGGEEGTGAGLPRPERDRQRRTVAAGGLVRATTPTTWRRSRSRCAARCITSSSPSTSGAASPTWPARRTASCSTRCRRASSTSRTNRSRAPFRGCSRRSTSARTSSGRTYADRNAKLCTIISEIAEGHGAVLDRHRHAGRRLRVPDRPVRRRLGQEGGRVLHAAADFRASSPASSRSTARSRRPASGSSWKACSTSPAAPARCC